jgi:ectoine hydroxylase-related dioxygenase (phytanoyl-CoA dioxygenase family)
VSLLTDDEVRRYQRDGFLAVERLADDEEVEWLARLCSALMTGSAVGRDLAGAGPGRAALPQFLYPERSEPEVLAIRFFARATALGAELMGRTDLDWFTHFIVKPAGRGASTAWHQDAAYDPVLRRAGCSVWLALDEATTDNGCLQFIPGSQHGPILRHQPIGGDPAAEGMEAPDADATTAVAVPAGRGGGSIHDHRVLHAAGPNATAADRRAYIVVGIAPG